MSITRDKLLAEQASLEQQEAKWRETVASADRVRADALSSLEAISGAKQLLAHLLKMTEADDGGASDCGGTSAEQSAPGGGAGTTPGGAGAQDVG